MDAGDYTVDAATVAIGEPVVNSLQAAGIRVKLRPLERAAFQKGYGDKKYKNLVHSGSAAFGNAATRIEAFIAAGGAYVYGSYPDIDGLFREQATELDKKRREATLHRIQQLIHDKAMVAPIVQVGLMSGYGPRVEESGLGLITGYSFSAPYEDVRLRESRRWHAWQSEVVTQRRPLVLAPEQSARLKLRHDQVDEVGERAGKYGGRTLKPSAASSTNHSSSVSAMRFGVPQRTQWPRAAAVRL